MRYRNPSSTDDRAFSALDSQITDSERFRNASAFIVRCRHCQGKLPFLPLNDPEVKVIFELLIRCYGLCFPSQANTS